MRSLLIVLIFFSTLAFAEESTIPQPDVSFFTKLRIDYSERTDFIGNWKLEDERKAVIAAYQVKEYKKAFELSERWLARCPVDSDIHMLRSTAASALGDIKSYMHHLHFAYGLLQSITQSGDGLTPKTAFKVIAVAEEYSVLNDFGAQVTGQSLVQEGPCDKMDCKLRDGTAISVYFNVSIPFKATAKRFKAE